MLNLDKTSNLGQKFAALYILLYHKLLPEIVGFIQAQQFLASSFIDNVKFYHLYVFWQTNDSNYPRLLNRLEWANTAMEGFHTNISAPMLCTLLPGY